MSQIINGPNDWEIEQFNNYAEEYEEYLRKRMCESEPFEHWKSMTPSLIFKYRSVSDSLSLIRSFDIIKNHRLFMSPSWLLNDPFEGGNVDYLSAIDKKEFETLLESCRILSLSQNCFSAPLWAHYTSECKGICIGFSTYKSFAGIKKIEYTDTIDKKQWWSTNKEDAILKEFIYKDKDWEYENEYRIVCDVNQEGLIRESDCEGNEKVFFPFDESEIAVVIFGKNIEKEIRDALIRIIPSTCLTFDIKNDKKRSRYYLDSCEYKNTSIYTLEELYKTIFL